MVERAECDAQLLFEGQPAVQTIPPATRRQVVRRDHGRCKVPGCRNGVYVDVHHIVLKSEGGDHDPDNLILACSGHHAAFHAGTPSVAGRASQGLTFRHADGTEYGREVSASTVSLYSEAFLALRSLGLGEGEARRAVQAAKSHVGPDARLEEVIRASVATVPER